MNSAERHRLKQLEKRRKKKAAKKKKKQEQKKDGGLQKESADLVGLIRKQESVSAGVKKEGEQETQEKSTEKEVEYVVEDVSSNPMFAQFKDILGKFANPLEMKKAREEELKERERVDALEAAGVDPSAAAQSTDTQQNGKEKASEGGDGDEDDEDDEDKVLSNKERKRLSRMSIAELKQMVTKPEVVELHDVNSHEPELLVQLKSYRNTVPVPGHWLQKRAYLTMKRGMEVRPFELPQFIEDTGISEIRTMQNDRDRDKTAAQRNKEKMNPKMGRIDIDYEVLHAAFFRYQTKPRMTSHGDLYFEGKEFSVKMSDHRPGQLSDELKRALGMNDELTPPPWLRNMQRYGPPPSYPNLKIAGINTPIPAGARCVFSRVSLLVYLRVYPCMSVLRTPTLCIYARSVFTQT